MSSFNIDSEVSGDEVQDLTMRWNYTAGVGREPRERRMEEPFEVPQLLKSLFNAILIFAGIATTLIALGYATGFIRIEDILR